MASRPGRLTLVPLDMRIVWLGMLLGFVGWFASAVVVRFGPGGSVAVCTAGGCPASSNGTYWMVQPGALLFLVGLLLIAIELWAGRRAARATGAAAAS